MRAQGDGFELLAGERRFRAAALAGLTEIPAVVRDCPSDAEAIAVMLAENLQREDLTPIEQARAIESLVRHGWTQARVAQMLGWSQPKVANSLRLLTLPAAVQAAIGEGKLSGAHGKALARFAPFPELLLAIAGIARDRKSSSKACERGLPFAEEIVRRDLARPLDGARFDTEICQACPCGAHVIDSDGKRYCVKVAHYAELETAAAAADPEAEARQAAERERAEAAREAAQRRRSAAAARVLEQPLWENARACALLAATVAGPPESCEQLAERPAAELLALALRALLERETPERAEWVAAGAPSVWDAPGADAEPIALDSWPLPGIGGNLPPALTTLLVCVVLVLMLVAGLHG